MEFFLSPAPHIGLIYLSIGVSRQEQISAATVLHTQLR